MVEVDLFAHEGYEDMDGCKMDEAKGNMPERQSTLLADEMGGILDDRREVRKSRAYQLCFVPWLQILTVREWLCYIPRTVDIPGFSIT